MNQDNLVYAFSTRKLQNMSLIYGDTLNSLQHRQDFLNNLKINYQDLICAKQVHASQIKYVQEEDRGKGALSYADAIDGTDGLITDKKNLPLAIFTADCLSIFLYAPKVPAIALIHAGRRSTQENITTKTIKLMQVQFNTKPANIYVAFGPAIRSCCYEMDLAQMNKQELLDLGVKEDNIFDSKICTFCSNDNFFSYRKEGHSCGRMMSVMMLK